MRELSLTSAASDTKWDELRLAMFASDDPPAFRCKVTNGNYSDVDQEWFYHFRDGGYADILFIDIILRTESQRERVLTELRKIGLAGNATVEGFRVYGYTEPGQELSKF